ncbi:hypothetical protein ATO6_08665 [Oceanicola sp. 22II-s10i]|uniref:NrsF family protein n=1 Tax=Oceanicola sp. 22II-s10i TaxID=1317116 RepID=UPI000B526D02|nr:DUF1109 domain-containing protein [Oceanicola sp. 22II-s10i]OWU85107.1 hypothetical protein ATO6_08665 [Oceanicola sp. 22II-s10i]
MKTEDLIAQLAADPAPAPADTLERRTGLALLAGGAVTVVLFLVLLGARPDLGAALSDPVVLAKTVLPLALALLALPLALRGARPGVAPGLPARVIWALPVASCALLAGAFVTTVPSERLALWIGHSIPVCLPMIVTLSAPILAGLIAALKRGAPVNPLREGALAGLVAAGLATAIYSTFCIEDSPLFYATWYVLGILIATGIGAVAGARFLRW